MDTTPLREARKSMGKTMLEIATAMGLSETTMSRIERGEQRASAEQAEQLSVLLGGRVSEMEILYPERYAHRWRAKDSTATKDVTEGGLV